MAAYLGDPSASLSLVGHAARLLSWASIAKQPLRRVSGLGRKPPLGGPGDFHRLNGGNRPVSAIRCVCPQGPITDQKAAVSSAGIDERSEF